MGDISKDIQSTFPNEHVKALINIKYTANWLDTIGNELMKPAKISVQQYNILRILRGAGEAITIKDVKERMIEKSPNATRLMDKLCDKNMIKRSRCEEDRRVVFVEITSKGLETIKKVKIEKFDAQMEKITEEEARTLNRILDKIR